jgi:hypothetical protein
MTEYKKAKAYIKGISNYFNVSTKTINNLTAQEAFVEESFRYYTEDAIEKALQQIFKSQKTYPTIQKVIDKIKENKHHNVLSYEEILQNINNNRYENDEIKEIKKQLLKNMGAGNYNSWFGNTYMKFESEGQLSNLLLITCKNHFIADYISKTYAKEFLKLGINNFRCITFDERERTWN